GTRQRGDRDGGALAGGGAGANAEPVRQRLQPRGPARLSQDWFPAGGTVRHRVVLSRSGVVVGPGRCRVTSETCSRIRAWWVCSNGRSPLMSRDDSTRGGDGEPFGDWCRYPNVTSYPLRTRSSSRAGARSRSSTPVPV